MLRLHEAAAFLKMSVPTFCLLDGLGLIPLARRYRGTFSWKREDLERWQPPNIREAKRLRLGDQIRRVNHGKD